MKFRLVSSLVSASCCLAMAASAAPLDKEGTPEPPSGTTASPVRVGVLGGVGAPRALTVEGMFLVSERVLLGLEYGVLPTSTFGGVSVSVSAVSGDLRIFPFRGGPFFLGARLGRQVLDANATVTVASYGSYSGSTHQESWFFGPRLGLLWVSRPGFTVGTSVGLQIPLSHKVDTTLPAGVPRDKVVPSVIDTLGGGGVIPTLDLLQLGVAF